ncbi:MAG: PadR family transcriptional regulator [Acidimicrobiales bacterium]
MGLEHDHGRRGRGPGGRAKRGEVRNGVLALLAEGPKHGYQIIQELGERSGGSWSPSPGSVYPILHRLEGAGVVAAEDHEDGRRVFTLTSTGQLVVDRLDLEKSPPWAAMGPVESDEARELRRLAVQFDGAIGQVADVATPDQLQRAAAIVAEARRRLYALLAEEPASPPESPDQ